MARERIEGYRAFANKLWNATRFVLMNLDPAEGRPALDRGALEPVDRWILSRYHRLAREVGADLEGFRFDLASNRIYQFLWREFCDWYIEWVKAPLLAGGAARAAATPEPHGGEGRQVAPPSAAELARGRAVRAVLLEVLDGTLRLLHPFMPHLTEELWQRIPGHGLSLVVAPFPPGDPAMEDAGAEEEIAAIVALVGTVRNLRAESGIDPAKRVPLLVHPHGPAEEAILGRHRAAVAALARCEAIELTADLGSRGPAARGVTDRFELALPLEGLLDIESEKKRLHKEREKLDKEIATRERKLGDASFLARAPAAVVEKERGIHEELTGKRDRIDRILATLGGG